MDTACLHQRVIVHFQPRGRVSCVPTQHLALAGQFSGGTQQQPLLMGSPCDMRAEDDQTLVADTEQLWGHLFRRHDTATLTGSARECRFDHHTSVSSSRHSASQLQNTRASAAPRLKPNMSINTSLSFRCSLSMIFCANWANCSLRNFVRYM